MKFMKLMASNGLVAALAFVLPAGIALGQASSTGSMAGTVSDSTGSVIAGASVTIVDQLSGTTYTDVTSGSGYYVIPAVRPGTYKETVTAPGFSVSETDGILVFVGTRAAQDVRLSIGKATETVIVNATGMRLETESSDIGTVLTTQQVLDLPLAVGGAFRSLTALSFLAPGAVGPGTNGGTFQSKIAGGQTLGSEYLIDGISTYRSENGSGNVDQTTPSLDSIQEFRVESSSLPADYGRTTGGVGNFKTRSGNNTYHGQVYDFYKNLALNANNWFNNYQISQLPDNHSRDKYQRGLDTKNDYGASLGGPVFIPHIYNGKDKTFFFFNFEQLRYHNGGVVQSVLPTAAQRGGDFSAFLGPVSTIINPCTGLPLQNGQLFDPAAPTQNIGGVICRSVTFQTGPNTQRIDPSRFSPLALKILALLPQPTPGLTNGFNYAQSYTNPQTQTDYSLRLDENVGSRNHFFAFGSARENSTGNAANLPEPLDSNGNVTDQFYKFGRAGWDFTITPHLVNSFAIGGNRVNSYNSSAASLTGTNYDAQLGIANAANPNTTFPSITIGGETNFPGFGNSNNDDNVDNGIIGNEAIIWTKGAHSVRIGGTYRWQQFSYNNNGPASGHFNFDRPQTSGSSNSGNITGNGIASFLLGAPFDIGRTIQLHAPRWISHYYAGFVQDDWKVRPNLTLNLGLRYSIDTPRHEAAGFSSNLDPTLLNPAVGLPGALAFAGMNGHPKNEAWADTYYKNFEPRVGFSYSPPWLHEKAVVRGAYTIISGPLEYADYGQGLSAGFTQQHDHNSFSILPVSSFDAGFPSSDVYAVNTDITQRNGNQQIDAVQRGDGRPSTIQNWSLETQTQLAPDLIFTLGYIGQHSVRLHSYVYEQNNIPYAALALGDLLGAPVNSPQAVAAGIKVPYPGFNGNVGQSLRPFPQFDFLSNDNFLQNRGQATYHAMEVKLERRFRNGLNLLASYTWSKTMTDADSIQPFFATLLGQGGTQNPYNLKTEKAASNQDVPNNFVVSYLYELPVGHGKTFLAHTPKVVDAVIGGWRIGGVQRYLSGQPVSFFGLATGPPNGTGFYFGIRPDRVAGQPLLTTVGASGKYDPHNLSQRLFNRSAFADQNAPNIRNGGPFRFGNMSRNVTEYRTPASLNEDLNVNKSFPIREGMGVDFRVEMFNAFNRHIFNKPDTGITDSNFGQINSVLIGPRNVQIVLKIHY